MIRPIVTINGREYEVRITYRFEGIDRILIWEIDEVRPVYYHRTGNVVTDKLILKRINEVCAIMSDSITEDCELDHKENLSYMQDFKRGIA